MAVISSELKLYGSAAITTDDTSPVGGAINAADEITGGAVGELFDSAPANSSGGADKTHYQKCFYKNTNAVDNLSNAVIFILNGLIASLTNGTVSAVSTSASDGATKYIKVYGFDAAGAAQTETITLNGVTPVSGSLTFILAGIWKVELRLVADDSLVVAAGDITIMRGIALGIIPVGYYSATAEIEIYLPATLNDTGTSTNRITPPGGSSFSKAFSESSSLNVANAGTLTASASQGIWLKRSIKAGLGATTDIEIVLRLKGTS